MKKQKFLMAGIRARLGRLKHNLNSLHPWILDLFILVKFNFRSSKKLNMELATPLYQIISCHYYMTDTGFLLPILHKFFQKKCTKFVIQKKCLLITSIFFCLFDREFLSRTDLYRQRIWQCAWSGKGGMTLEEALISERNANAELSQIDPVLRSSILGLVQNSCCCS